MSQNHEASFRMGAVPFHVKLALIAAGTGIAPATLAQAVEEGQVIDEVVATGVRGSLMTSQALKRNSAVFIDAVTSEDIGALPDRSVTEVLARIPGVSISRFAGADDPDHFSVEGAGTVVRGLTLVRSELNGRDVFTADAGQALGFSNVPPELMQSVQVFKSQSADLIEGGIGGTVNLVTRKPFDRAADTLAFSAESNYSDFSEEWTPQVSALYSNRWVLEGGGEFGALISASYSELETRADGTLVADWLDRGDGNLVPAGAGIRTQDFARERSGVSAALQWASADESMEATFEFFHSAYENTWNEHAIEPSIDDSPGIIPRAGTSFSFASSGLFESGVLSESVGWRSNEATIPLNGVRNLALVRQRVENPETQDYALNLRWSPSDRWRTQFEIQRVESDVSVKDDTVHNAFYADTVLDLNGDVPQVTYLPPDGEADDYLSQPGAYYVRSIMDHLQDNEGSETAARLDAEFDFLGDSWADSLRFGVRFSNREQIVRSTTFNWGNMSANWNQPWLLSSANNPGDLFAPYTFSNYQRGNAPGAENVLFYNGGFSAAELRDLAALSGVASWVPLEDRGGVVPGTPFLPGEINDVEQDTTAFYVRFDFSNDFDNGMTLDGNMGVRYVQTDQSAAGGINYPDFNAFTGGGDLTTICNPPDPSATVPGFCLIPASDQASFAAWADGSSEVIEDDYDFDNWLPSLNLRLGLNDEMQLRFGVSRSISRPDFGLLKSVFSINFGGDDPVTGQWLGPDAATANVRLEPITSDNVDMSFEWYFADVGSVTVTAFYKELQDYIVPATFVRSFTNNGETWDVAVAGVGNSPEDGTVKGIELTYQQVYDMLPGFMQYFGIQTNYTYLDSSGVPNVGPKNDEPNGSPNQPNFDVSGLGLPGLSEDTFNFTAFWENDTVSARLAYNYRSEFHAHDRAM